MNENQKRYTVERIEKYNNELDTNIRIVLSVSSLLAVEALFTFMGLMQRPYSIELLDYIFTMQYIGCIGATFFPISLAILIHYICRSNSIKLKIEDLQSSLEMAELEAKDYKDIYTRTMRK